VERPRDARGFARTGLCDQDEASPFANGADHVGQDRIDRESQINAFYPMLRAQWCSSWMTR
jgi:hypothetical protein